MTLSSRSKVSFLLSLISSVALVGVLAMSVVLQHSAAHALSPDVLVSNGSPTAPFPRNKQNEPALAVDANQPNILAAGSNDNIDLAPCVGSRCPFTAGVGVSGIYFSFDSGTSWTQPTYTGWSARSGTPGVGPIGTLPKYFESGLVSGGDPALAFGPRPGPGGTFSWSNGERLYYANLTSNFNAVRSEEAFKGFEAIAVSRTDDVASAAAGHNSAWMDPVLVSKQSSTTFSDKDQIWADNASSSPFFGNVYVCWASFRSQEKGLNGMIAPQPLIVAVSTDGGTTWTQKQVTTASDNPFNTKQGFGRTGCTVRTDSHGVVYVFANQIAVGTPGNSSHIMIKSFDGGKSWTRPQNIGLAVNTCFLLQFDGSIFRCVMDGVGGARDDLSASPSVDIANGAPTGARATDEILRTWVDGRDGANNVHVFVSSSTDGGNSWSDPTVAPAETAGDRGYYSAIAISPKGTDAYLVYNAFTTPLFNDTTSPRTLVGVVKHADIGANGALGTWSELHRGAAGDPRGSGQNNLWLEFLGDYVYAVATDTYGAAVWNDTRNAADCPAVDAWRAAAQAAVQNGTAVPPKPAPLVDCPATFGNSDIFGGSYPP